jgi:hypothetical protein
LRRSAGVGLIFTEKQTMKFTPLGGGPVDHYTGSIDEVGLSIGATEGGVLVWKPSPPSRAACRRNSCRQVYRADADASVGIGSANILIGGNNSAFMLQPTSYEGQVGLNVAAGVTTVTLTWLNSGPRHRRACCLLASIHSTSI